MLMSSSKLQLPSWPHPYLEMVWRMEVFGIGIGNGNGKCIKFSLSVLYNYSCCLEY